MKRKAFAWHTLLLSASVLMGAIAPAGLTTQASDLETKQNAGVRVEVERDELRLTSNGEIITLTPDTFQAHVFDAVNCAELRLEPEQQLEGRLFFDTVAIDPATGNIAVGVLLTECLETQVSAVFTLVPRQGSYALYQVSVPGDRPLPNAYSTFPLSSIINLGYFANQLLVQHGDASGTTSMLIFSTDEHPAGHYRGCIVTNEGESSRLCPPEDAMVFPPDRGQ
ncbi:MAG: hypothetical protein AAFX78_17510 [Cyanobacteria bacterium J06638_20]